jgi:hypothetical protein
MFLWTRDKPQTTADVDNGYSTQPGPMGGTPLRPSRGRTFAGRTSAAILYTMRAIGAGWRTGMGARAWLLQSASARLGDGMGCDLGAAVRVSKLRAHHEPIARLAASLAMVCGDSHRGSALSALDCAGDSTGDRHKIRTPSGCAAMAESAALASAVAGITDIVGLAGIKTGHPEAGREPPTGPTIFESMARRDAHSWEFGGQSCWQVGMGSEVEPERAGA